MSEETPAPGSIAIIGLAGRFPGAPDLDTFWKNLRDGVESIRRFSREELLAAGLPEALIDDPKFVPARSVLDDADLFDADFFHIAPREAELLDPQHRVLLELAWEAFEHAGYDPAKLSGPAGVFAGASLNTYFLHNLCADRAAIERFTTDFQTDSLPLLLGTDKDYLATRLAYKLNLKGPAITVQTACSTSLVAVCQAVQALLSYQCDTALAGGVSIAFPQMRGHLYQEGAIGSADGHCRAFDAQAGGTVFGSGAGLVLLKRLEDALADGDYIHAVIRGCAVNNDGSDKASYTAPSVAGQAEVITLAQAVAGVSADSISYVEAHGTATPLGDPIEVAALTQAFRATTKATSFCALGTVKSNLGHLESASGVTGLIKTALALEHEELPPSLHFTAPNPKIAFAGSPFHVISEREPWPRSESPRRAGVSSFGVGGTNAHVVLEEAPAVVASTAPRKAHLLVLSARTASALEAATNNLALHLEAHPAISLADVAYTLQIGRRTFAHRRFLFAVDAADAITALRRCELGRVLSSVSSAQPAKPVSADDKQSALAQRWLDGEDVDWAAFYALTGEKRQRLPLPHYPFERQRYWIEPPVSAPVPALPVQTTAVETPATAEPVAQNYPELVRQLLQEISGLDLTAAPLDATLFELGFDSLVLTQAAHEFRKRFGVKITFRQLLEDLTTLGGIADHVAANATSAPVASVAKTERVQVVSEPEKPASKAFGPYRPIEKGSSGGLTERQQTHLNALIARTLAKTPESKRRTQANRRHFADPRSVSGFRALWKEMVYPIITTRSSGARFWDVDGNEYLDVTMGFGTNLLGHAPEFITHALQDQLTRGIEVGPQSPLAGEVAQLLCELTGHERTAFCNTGSEAVLAAVRVARTVTGRTRIATTSGFHGINDEVLVRAGIVNGEHRGRPVAPGIPEHIAREVLVLEYGTEQALDLLQKHAHDLAAILIEPVQSRRPDLQPRAFIQEARRITKESGTALIFDEVINGFRIHLGGAQSFFGVQSDISTWGKIIGGGMPIGAVTGSATYLDALDGGHWQFGDDSFPEVGVTFFAGTYVRHPLAMAASRAILRYLKEQGPALQQRLGDRTEAMVREINEFAAGRGVPLHIEQCASLFYFHFPSDIPHGSLLWFYLREKGLHIWEGRPCFLSTAHTDTDIAQIVRIFKESILEMQEAGFLPGHDVGAETTSAIASAEIAAPARAAAVSVSTPAPLVLERPIINRPVRFSLYFFGHYPAEYRSGKYDLLFEAAKFADVHGFEAIWLPERHFHAVGGFSPNPSLLAAALARETKQLQLRAGSVVLPLHHPMRVAEEWSVVDNLAPGRVGLSIASGWHPNDFIFAPDAFEGRRELNFENLATIRRLWKGDSVEFPAGNRVPFSATVYPQPSTRELPVWLTCIHQESFEKAGELGLGVVGYLMNQTLEEVGTKIAAYRAAFARAGHDPAKAHVTILLHTFVGAERDSARRIARGPLREYLRSFLDNSQKRHEAGGTQVQMDAEDMEYLLDRAFEDYAGSKALLGSPESCAAIVENLTALGVDEIGCFMDFGVDPQTVLASLPKLAELKARCESKPAEPQVLPLTAAQSGLWFVGQFGEGAVRINAESCTLEIRGALDPERLHVALQKLVQRHDALRTSFAAEGATQIVHPHAELPLPIVAVSEAELSAQFLAFDAEEFSFTEAPLLATRLLKLEPERHLLLFRFHHLLGNGPSYWLLFEELVKLYRGESLEPATLQLGDFVRWKNAQPTEEDEAFWLATLAEPPPAIALPLSHVRPATPSFRGDRVVRPLDATLTRALREAGAKERASLFMMLFAGWQVLLHQLSGQTDFVVGVPFESGARDLPGGPQLFANTTNMAPLRVKLDAALPFRELLTRTKSNVLAATEHQELFFGHLLRKLGYRAGSGNAVFNTAFNYETGKFDREANGTRFVLKTQGVPYRNAHDISPSEVNVNVAENDGELLIECDFQTDLFAKAAVESWLADYERILRAVSADPAQPLQSLLPTRSATPTIAAHFEGQAARTPQAIAVISGTTTLTYQALNERANQLAHRLQRAGVAADEVVAILAERSIDMVVAMLATIKAGGAYLPLDPDAPAARLETMIGQAKPRVILANATAHVHSSTVPMWRIADDYSTESAENLGVATSPENLAYVIYTSGSTGVPKAVAVPAASLLRLVKENGFAQFLPTDIVAQSIAATFDPAVMEIWGALLNGARLVIIPHETLLSANTLSHAITTHKISVMVLPTALFHQLAGSDPGMFRSLRVFIFGGERADAAVLRSVCQAGTPAHLVNAYGPTENGVTSTAYEITAAPTGEVPIGEAIKGSEALLFDDALQPVLNGGSGELFVGGSGLARGYLNDPALTAERFIEWQGRRLYRTGDLAQRRPDGQFVFLGRRDHQVKHRGFRIELGEVETALLALAGVREAAVLLQNERLVAFISGSPRGASWREALATKLPEYMVPQQLIELPALPLTSAGKIDRQKLAQQPAKAVAPVSSASDTRSQLARIWEELLGESAPNDDASFFECGGHSLLAIQLLARIKRKLHTEVTVQQLFSNPTINGLTSLIAADDDDSTAPTPQHYSDLLIEVQAGEPGQRPLFLMPGGGGGDVELLICKSLAQHIGAELPIIGIRARGWRAGEESYTSLDQIATDYVAAIRTAQPSGPYQLAGQCLGCIVTVEVARRLQEQGEEIAKLLLIGVGERHEDSLGALKRRIVMGKLPSFWRDRVAQPAREHLEKMSRLSLAEKGGYIMNRVLRKAGLAAAPAPAAESAPELEFHPRFYRHVQAIVTSPTTPFPGKAILLVDEKSHANGAGEDWRDLAQEVECHVLPGDELSYLREHAATSGRIIRECLELEAVLR